MVSPRIKKASDDRILVICGGAGGVYAVMSDGSGAGIVSEKRVSNLLYDASKGDYHYVTADGRLDQSLPPELSAAEDEKKKETLADLLAVSRIEKAAVNPLTTLRTHVAATPTDSLLHKPVSLNLNRLLMEAL